MKLKFAKLIILAFILFILAFVVAVCVIEPIIGGILVFAGLMIWAVYTFIQEDLKL